MRILVLTNLYPPHVIGGYEIRCQEMVRMLAKRGHVIEVLTSNYHTVEAPACPSVDAWLSQSTIGVKRKLPWEHRRRSHLWVIWEELKGVSVAKRVLDEFRPNVIWVWNMARVPRALLITLQRSQVPLVFHVEDRWLAEFGERNRWLRWWVTRRQRSLWRYVGRIIDPFMPTFYGELRLDHVTFVSTFQASECASVGIHPRHAKVLGGGIDTHRFYRARTGDGWCKGRSLRLLYSGGIALSKGVHTVIEALGELPPSIRQYFTLTITGWSRSTEYFAYLRRLVDQLSLGQTVSFRKPVSYQMMPCVYEEHDILVFPSQRNEGIPLAVLEAMVAGLLVIGTTTGGTGDVLVDGQTGLIFKPGDREGLAHQLAEVCASPGRYNRIRLQGQNLVMEQYDLAVVSKEMEDFLVAACRSRAKSKVRGAAMPESV